MSLTVLSDVLENGTAHGSEIISVVERRRRWPAEENLRILVEALKPGASVAAVSAAIRDRVVRDVNAVLSDSSVGERLAAAGQHVIGGEPETLLELIKQQEDRVHEISKLIDLKSTK